MRLTVTLIAAGLLAAGCSAPVGPDDVAATAGPQADDPSDERTAAADPAPAPPPSPASPTPTPEPSPTPDPLSADLVVVRDDAGFTSGTVASLEALPGVAEAAGRRNDEVPLWGSTAADGSPVDVFPAGFQVVMTALVHEPDLPGPAPSPGEAVLTARGVATRGLGVGARLVLGPDRRTLTVVAVASESDAFGSAELVVHPDDGDALDVEPLDRLVLLLDRDTDVTDVADGARTVLGRDDPRSVEVREATDGPRQRRTLSSSRARDLFGEFAFRDRPGTRDIDQDPAWVSANLVSREVPLLGTVRCHRSMIDDLAAALDDVVAAGEGGWVDASRSSGCWAPRRIREGGGLSKHAFGIAVDINIDFSLPGLGEVPPDAVIAAFERHGFSWGGRFPNPDNHHWEWVGEG